MKPARIYILDVACGACKRSLAGSTPPPRSHERSEGLFFFLLALAELEGSAVIRARMDSIVERNVSQYFPRAHPENRKARMKVSDEGFQAFEEARTRFPAVWSQGFRIRHRFGLSQVKFVSLFQSGVEISVTGQTELMLGGSLVELGV